VTAGALLEILANAAAKRFTGAARYKCDIHTTIYTITVRTGRLVRARTVEWFCFFG
jgi:hypothetical protein